MPKQKPSRTAPELVAAPADLSPPGRFLPLLLLLFVGSGCAALIYEVVWLQLLQLVVGSSAVSLGVLLGTYMGGMCLGSLLLPRFVAPSRHPLRVYGAIEMGIGILGVLVLFCLPLIHWIYSGAVGSGLPAILLRGVVAALCLLPPTLLMGASLPAMARWVEATPRGVSWLGFFYGGNIAGAVFGCLLAGFYLLRVHDMGTATYVAAAINIGVALLSVALAARAPHDPPAQTSGAGFARPKGTWPVYGALALSGMCALGAEVIWTRLLSLMLGATVYTFSIILAVFLAGLGIGSAVASVLARQIARPRAALGLCQLLLAGTVAWAAYSLSESIPNWPINPLLSRSPWFTFQVDIMRALWAIFPAACLWGASFPLGLACIASRKQDAGRVVGEAYAANTVGAIVGAVGLSMVLIPGLGTQNAQRILIGLSVVSALVMFLSIPRRTAEQEDAAGEPRLRMGAIASIAAAVLAAVFLITSVAEVPWVAIAYGRRMATKPNPGEALYVGEGMNSSVAVTRLPYGAIYFHVSGKVEASTEPYDMRLQRMLGHIPALIHPKPRSVLVVGFGAGVTAGSLVPHPSVERIVICEIEPLIPPATGRYFRRENYAVLDDPRTRVVYDDGRHHILTTRETFDIITSDPIHPWVKGTATLYSKEYFELVKKHLNPGGVVTQWVPLYESDLETVKSVVATFFEVFPNGTIWGNTNEGGYDVVLLGQAEPLKINADELQERLDREDHAPVLNSLREVGFGSAIHVLSTYAGRASDLGPWLEGAEINRDLTMRLQYVAGMSVNNDLAGYIYSDMLRYLRFPDDMITGSEQRLQTLRFALEASRSGQ